MQTAVASEKMQVGGFAGWCIELVQRLLRRSEDRRHKRQMSVVEVLPLGGKRQLTLVTVSGQRFLVGVSEGVDSIIAVDAHSEESQPGSWRAGL